MNDARPAGSNRLLFVVAILTVVSVASTLGISMLLGGEQRGFTLNVMTAFLCMVETAIGLLLASSMMRRAGSGATTGILVATVVIYAIIGFCTIGIYAVAQGDGGHHNWLWAALLAETTLTFLAAGAFWGVGSAMEASELPVLARRADHAASGRMVRDAASRLRGLTLKDAAAMNRADQLVKRLDAIASALSHSHGGGIGSREAGRSAPVDASVDQDLAEAARALADDAAQIRPDGDVASGLARVAAGADRLRSAVDRLGLA